MIGNLRHRAELLAPVQTPDGGGGFAISYTLVDEVAAEIEPRRTGQHKSAGFAVPAARHRVTIRHRDDLSVSYRLRFEGDDHRILDLQNDPTRERFLTLDVEAVVR